MTTLVVIDGRLLAAEAASVSVFDRGFLYGDSVFETLRTYGGRPFALDRHLSRLARSASRVHIDVPVALDQLANEVNRAILAGGNAESYVRVMLTRGVGETLGLDPGLARHPLRVVIVAELSLPPLQAYSEGIATVTHRLARATDDGAAHGAKVGNYLTAVLAQRTARNAGAAEALVVDARGRVIEGATSNVFAVMADGSLVTPPEADGILLGITRETVLAVAAELGIRAEQRSLPLTELMNAAEVFVCSSIREIVPVVSIDGQRVGAGVPGRISQALLGALREKCRKSVGL